MKKITLSIDGMTCSACSTGLEKYLKKQEGIKAATVNLVLAQASIEYDEALTIDDLERFIKEAGFVSLGIYNPNLLEKKKESKKGLLFFGIVTFILFYISMAPMIHLPSLPFLDMENHSKNYVISLFVLLLPILYYGRDIFKNGIKNLVHKSPNMDTLVSLGVTASFLYSVFEMILILLDKIPVRHLYFESCGMIIFFIKLGRFIDGKSKEKTKEALKELVQITPSKALLKIGNKEKEVTIDEVSVGDILIAKPGMKIAVDGVIISGETHLEEAFITGESIPVKKGVDNSVIAGSMNIDGYIEYRAERIGKNSTISEIVKLVVEATSTKAPIERIADIVSGYFVPTIMIISVLTLLGYLLLGYGIEESITSFVTVLVVACPCALGLATPLAIVVSEGVCAKNGILVKSSEVLENASKVDTIVFDKTGTLTYGNLKISKIYKDNTYEEKELLKIIASIESKSTHPIAGAFIEYAKENNLNLEEVNDFENIPGLGLRATIDKCEYYIGNDKVLKKLSIKNIYTKEAKELSNLGNSLVYVIIDSKIIALIGVKDIIRDNGKGTIKKLTDMGKEIIMLTGDNKETATIIADSLGIKNVIANVLPKEKAKVISSLLKENKKVMMVGDGINDAPSLATATIGVSVNSGTDIAADSSDVILMQDNLEKIPTFLKISKRTLRIIKQNLFWAFFYNLCMIPLAIGFLKPFGISMNPMFASIAMTCSSLTVVFNSLRIKNRD